LKKNFGIKSLKKAVGKKWGYKKRDKKPWQKKL